ncbi:MAG: response regulator [Lachnospiraceae bacterium]|nr:response regulator [Lachnospiraceae bacterium]
MDKNSMIVTGDKESFIVRVLIKKLRDAGIDCSFVPNTVNDINSKLSAISLLVLYMEDDVRPREDVLHFLKEKLDENNVQMILIGAQHDVRDICDNVPGELVYKTFSRPVDNEGFVATVTEYFKKMESGEFRKSILIVDDDPNYLGLVRQWLKGTYKVAMANSGLQAIKWLGHNKVDLILLDYEMPVTTGPQVLEMLRSDNETRSIPVMFLTGRSDKESVMSVLALRPEGYFLKTIQREELLEKLNDYFIMHK